jgi:hypothetical protein
LTGENSSGAPREAENKGPVSEVAPSIVDSSSSGVGSVKAESIRYTVKSKSEEPSVTNLALIVLFLVVAAAVIYMRGGQSVVLNAPGLNQGTLPPQIIPSTTLTVRKYNITLSSCTELKNSESIEALDCFTELALKEKNIEVCNVLDNKNVTYNPRDPCIRHYALKAFDSTKCDVFGNNTRLSVDCLIELSFNISDPSLCSKMEEKSPTFLQSMCFLKYVTYRVSFNKPSTVEQLNSYCGAIPDSDLRFYCQGIVNRDKMYCGQISPKSWVSPWLTKRCLKCVDRVTPACIPDMDLTSNTGRLNENWKNVPN